MGSRYQRWRFVRGICPMPRDKEKKKACAKRYREKHRKEISESGKKYYRENKDILSNMILYLEKYERKV